jgi:hypothetical protein
MNNLFREEHVVKSSQNDCHLPSALIEVKERVMPHWLQMTGQGYAVDLVGASGRLYSLQVPARRLVEPNAWHHNSLRTRCLPALIRYLRASDPTLCLGLHANIAVWPSIWLVYRNGCDMRQCTFVGASSFRVV